MSVVIIQDGEMVEVESSDQVVEILENEYTVDIESVVVDGAPYAGPYEVTPRVSQQVLSTNQKYMNDDVTVFGVPRYDVRNDYGTTCVIAEEV